MMKLKRIMDMVYLILLGATIGGILAIGIIMTSTIFNSEAYIGPLLSHYQEGSIMSAGFDKFSYFLGFMGIVIFSYEMFSYKTLQTDKTVILTTLVALSTIGLFIGVYMPKILEMQAQGEEVTKSIAFENLHLGSEIDFKILLISLIVLMGRRLYVLLGKKYA
ncbi:MAG: DUF4149 domain-containing protein [Campylobacterales bacterium]|nr:DUF4149 domain-containing protein [Campylobacterales bacterium]